MSKTYRGSSWLKLQDPPVRRASSSQWIRKHVLAIESLKGEVHRFEGTVDRIGGAVTPEGIIQTVCIRDLVHSRTGQQLSIDHWWFRLQSVWMDASIRPGDRVVFVAKVQRCSKGCAALGSADSGIGGNRRQVVGFSSNVRSVVAKTRLNAGREAGLMSTGF